MSYFVIKVVFFFINILHSMEIMVEIFDFERLAMRRLLLAHTMLKIASQYGANSTRSIWMKARRQMFWEVDCQVNSDAFFKSNFRMKRQSFNKLCIMLKGLERKNTNYRKSIQLEKRIAIAVYALGSSADYRTIGNMFGIGKSSVCTILIEFCREVWRCLWPLYLNKFPMNEIQLREYLNGFESLGFPQVLGAIDGCHIEVRPTTEDAMDYYNDKGRYSTVLLALVDARCRFIYINVGSPGSCNDSSIFESSSLKCQLVQSSLFKDVSKQISSVNVPVVLLGDSAFKLDEHLMKPYPFRKNQPLNEKKYNNALSKCHRVVETAFDHLKARFRRVGKGFESHMANTKAVIKACCVLHNFLNEENDEINVRWIAAQQIENQTRQLPENEPDIPGNVSPRAEEIRQAFVSYFGK
uniref:Putative nuclease HARBI1 n=1 Tax=Bactrocera dorsalis TaxID=27457 RepID=A0A034VUS6_BACDO